MALWPQKLFEPCIHCRSALLADHRSSAQESHPYGAFIGSTEAPRERGRDLTSYSSLMRCLLQHSSKLGQCLEGLGPGCTHGRGEKGRNPYLFRQIWVWTLLCHWVAQVRLHIPEALWASISHLENDKENKSIQWLWRISEIRSESSKQVSGAHKSRPLPFCDK